MSASLPSELIDRTQPAADLDALIELTGCDDLVALQPVVDEFLIESQRASEAMAQAMWAPSPCVNC